jgi:hypothetical protein
MISSSFYGTEFEAKYIQVNLAPADPRTEIRSACVMSLSLGPL